MIEPRQVATIMTVLSMIKEHPSMCPTVESIREKGINIPDGEDPGPCFQLRRYKDRPCIGMTDLGRGLYSAVAYSDGATTIDAGDSKLFAEVQIEMDQQDKKWGEQNHPDLDPVLVGREGGATPQRHAEDLEIPTSNRAKFLTDSSAERGECCWGKILVEEVAEVVEQAALDNASSLRTELVQSAAVIMQWIKCIDRREEKK